MLITLFNRLESLSHEVFSAAIQFLKESSTLEAIHPVLVPNAMPHSGNFLLCGN